jgi:hypothetical protein
MDSSRTSLELLAHFEPPTERESLPLPGIPLRGVPWVVKWAVALGMLFVAACVLLQFGYCAAAEQALARAAQAGALEATLPRATQQSVVETIERRLTGYSIPTGALRIAVLQNGVPVRRALHIADDDRISVTLSLEATSVLPNWLRAVAFWNGESQIEARAERRIPGRQLKMAARE